jgi:hypothetical protein
VKTFLEEEKIRDTIERIPKNTFSVLDFITVFREAYRKNGSTCLSGLVNFGEAKVYYNDLHFQSA